MDPTLPGSTIALTWRDLPHCRFARPAADRPEPEPPTSSERNRRSSICHTRHADGADEDSGRRDTSPRACLRFVRGNAFGSILRSRSPRENAARVDPERLAIGRTRAAALAPVSSSRYSSSALAEIRQSTGRFRPVHVISTPPGPQLQAVLFVLLDFGQFERDEVKARAA
jgi:hypothetical protein